MRGFRAFSHFKRPADEYYFPTLQTFDPGRAAKGFLIRPN